MKKVILFAVFFLTILPVLSGCISSESISGIKDEYTLDLSELPNFILSVSPDGEMIVCMDKDKIYFYDREGDKIEGIKIGKDIILRYPIRALGNNEKCTWSEDGRYLLIDTSNEALAYLINTNIILIDTLEFDFIEVSDNDTTIVNNKDKLSPCYAPCFSTDDSSVFYLQRDFKKGEVYLMEYNIEKGESEEVYEFDDELFVYSLINIDDNHFVGHSFNASRLVIGIDVENDDIDELVEDDFKIVKSDKSVELVINNFFIYYSMLSYGTHNGVVYNFAPQMGRESSKVIAQFYEIDYVKGDWEVTEIIDNDKEDRIVSYIPSDSGKYALLTLAKYEKNDDNMYEESKEIKREIILCEIKDGEYIEIEELGKNNYRGYGLEQHRIGTGIALNGNCTYIIEEDKLRVFILE